METPKRVNDRKPVLVTPKREHIERKLMPSPLMASPKTPRFIPKANSLLALDRKFPAVEESEEMSGKAGLVYLATSNPGRQTVAIKRQILDDPADQDSTAYRELKIMKCLDKMIPGNHNFIKLLDWNKCWLEVTPPRKKMNEGKIPVQCMNMVMKQAGETLHSLICSGEVSTLYEFKHILFQVLISLAKAQKTCEFVHNDLHLRNILVDFPVRSPAVTKYHKYEYDQMEWYIDSKIIVTIVDFGLSRITQADGSQIHNTIHSAFLPSSDVEHLQTGFAKFKIKTWSHTIEESSCSVEEEKARKKLKRSFMTRMRKGDSPAKLITHEFFNSLKEPINLNDGLPLPSIVAKAVPRSDSFPPRPQDVELLLQNNKKSIDITRITPSPLTMKLAKELDSKKKQETKKSTAVSIITNLHHIQKKTSNVLNNITNITGSSSIIGKRKRPKFSLLPGPKPKRSKTSSSLK